VVTIHETPYLRINLAVGLLAVIAIVAALYLARAFFVPLLITSSNKIDMIEN
jgi:hypothetical protein